MTSVRRINAIVEAKRRRDAAITLAGRADKARRRERTPAAKERFVAACRAVTAADDALERLGVARG